MSAPPAEIHPPGLPRAARGVANCKVCRSNARHQTGRGTDQLSRRFSNSGSKPASFL
jgi:hypothetical protein